MATVESVLDFDTCLMLRVREEHVPSFELLLTRHRTPVVRHLYRMVHNQTIAEELAQDVFLRIYRSRLRYEPSAKFTTWLFHIATNVALNWMRDTRKHLAEIHADWLSSEARRFELADSRPRADEAMLRQHRAAEIRSAIQTLPGKQRAAVLMHKYEGMEYCRIAEVLDCSIPALKSLLFRAYATLRRRLAHLEPLPKR